MLHGVMTGIKVDGDIQIWDFWSDDDDVIRYDAFKIVNVIMLLMQLLMFTKKRME